MLDKKRHLFKDILKEIGNLFSRFPFSPDQYTFVSIIFSLLAAFFIIKQSFLFALIFFVIAACLDSIDGAVARKKNIETKKGAYLDTIIDRYVEGITLFSMLFLPLPKIFLEPYVWIFLALFGSVVTTYSKAAAKEKDLVNVELKGGLFSRGERLITMSLMLFMAIFDRTFLSTSYLLILMVFLVNITAVQRICSAISDKKHT
ncbi:MAG: CDP-alcohol phosphatidyltransferase family protein [Candidatus Paceibacterota bacterium]